MSSATPSSHLPVGTGERSIAAVARLAYGVRATAFWAATLLPIAIVASIAVGAAGQYPLALAGALAVNAVCAVVGHGHAPGGD
jgi:ABC-type microcin C transport system permease subunit YejE